MTEPDLIIGGGLAGITVAVHLQQKRRDFLLLESSPRLGGKVETQKTNEACYEFGPNSFANPTEETFELLEMIGLTDKILTSSPAAQNRYILRDGGIVRLPFKPPEMLTTKSLSLIGRLRFLREIFYVPRKKIDEESVWDFFARHFGKEVANYFADPFVSGIFAGDVKQISVREAFPAIAQAEDVSSSLIRYLISKRKTSKASPSSYQLKEGLESIFKAAQEKIGGEKIFCDCPVREVVPEGDLWRVMTDGQEYRTPRLYLSAPAYVAATILKGHFPDLSEALDGIDYAPVVTIHLKVPATEEYPFNGFGILIPSSERREILGVLWNSTAFPALFHDKKHHYLTVYAGGARRRDIMDKDDASIEEMICREVQTLFSLRERPIFVQMRRYFRAIPQYTLGYGNILKSIRKFTASHPSLRLTGNYIGGISMAKTVTQAAEAVIA